MLQSSLYPTRIKIQSIPYINIAKATVEKKIDLGFIFSEVSKVELDEFKGFFEQYGYADHVIDVYKVRSGAYKNVRIWCQINMGNGERKDLFMTTQDKKVIQLESYEFLKKLESIPVDLYDYIKKGDAQ